MINSGYGSACLWLPGRRKIQYSRPAWGGYTFTVNRKFIMWPCDRNLNRISFFCPLFEIGKKSRNPQYYTIGALSGNLVNKVRKRLRDHGSYLSPTASTKLLIKLLGWGGELWPLNKFSLLYKQFLSISKCKRLKRRRTLYIFIRLYCEGSCFYSLSQERIKNQQCQL